MHSLIQDIAKKLDITSREAEEIVSSILIRIRAALRAAGEAKVSGLGTFRLIDESIVFEPSSELENAVNKEYAGLKPVALTATGESVPIGDARALPGVDTEDDDAEESAVQVQAEVAAEEEFEQPSLEEHAVEADLPDVADTFVESLEQDAAESGPGDTESEPEPELEPVMESEIESAFTSPPPPIPSKVRIPPKERRAARQGARRKKSPDEIPDMGPVVAERPEETIHDGRSRRRDLKWPMIAGAAVVLIAVSWMMLGGEDAAPSVESPAAEVAPAPSSEISTPARAQSSSPTEPVAEAEPATEQTESLSAGRLRAVPAGGRSTAPPREVATPEPEPEPAEPPVTAPAAANSGPLYAWIVASFPNESEAAARVERLRSGGFNANVYEATVRGQPAYRVGVGQFSSEGDARRNRDDDVPPESTDAWLTRVR